jgi:hypothetical protein
MTSLLTIEAITKEALSVLEDELGREHPTESYILNTNESKYTFRKYQRGWMLYNDKDLRPLLEGLTDEEMWAHIKLLRS